ncbi:DUF4159 domain-containing protein [Roseibium litorale]|uniref:DUF4159 domain-containing protein n=1 Tax=Roseibium litorale TaxID=2803841 RepID=A0ABR9CKI0_9HYPH|nr:DUF4159 domain-containing protein [Roseibium litorale]MBD8891352.1 DUF4159 domain-containing protein [Roseibium litorale]
MGFLPIAFSSPWILTALALLPVIWWLLRLTPPRPRQVQFPPTRLLLDIEEREETPQRSPWWLTLLRLLLAAILIIALAGPVWRPAKDIAMNEGPLWILLDNGWTAASSWTERSAAADRILSDASRSGRPVLLTATADGPAQSFEPGSAVAAQERLRALEPRPWTANRGELTTGLRKSAGNVAPGAIVWLSDRTQPDSGTTFQQDLARIAGGTPVIVYQGLGIPMGLKALDNTAQALNVTVLRHPEDGRSAATLRALDLKGVPLAETSVQFDADAPETVAEFDLPSELRNDIARVEIAGTQAAGAVQLLDDSWRRRVVGLISGEAGDLAQPLLSPLYYLQRALSPFSDLRLPEQTDIADAVPELIGQGISVLILADVGRLPEDTLATLSKWVEDGGMLIRFAGPRTAGGTDDLIPVTLRAGDRTLGGSLSWKQPQKLAAFADTSPFAGLEVPDEVTVSRQVLAEPTSDLPDRTWATLEDGTPLVTAHQTGKGMLVLFHVTADTSWSNLPLSGTFIDLLRRTLALASSGAATANSSSGADQSVLPPLRLLDGFGRFTSPPADVTPITVADFQHASASRKTPAGLYGSEDGFQALNLLAPDAALLPLDLSAFGGAADVRTYPSNDTMDLRAILFSLAFLLLLLDAAVVILLMGGMSWLRLRPVTARALLPLALGLSLGLAALPGESRAQSSSDDVRALEATLETRLAYVITGVPEIDEASAAGLSGLSMFLADRTALEPGSPLGVDISRDELAFYSLLYWPIDPDAEKPDARTISRIDTFMRNGGTILFDTRDHLTSTTTGFGSTPATLKLREILDGLDIPPLEPVPPDHVLTKTFYLLDTFPGRYATSPLWVESLEQAVTNGERPVRAGDGVSPIMITGNDFAAAWAVDDSGSFLYPTVPDDPVQRDYAFRAGVNIVMYTLTGNYKADQVHIPALLERLGQ